MSDENNVFPLIQKRDPLTQKLYELGTDIDQLVIHAAGQGLTLYEIAGIISHRLGEVIKNFPPEEKEKVDIFIDIILTRAGLSNV